MKDRYKSSVQLQATLEITKPNISSVSGNVLDALHILIPPFILYFKQMLLLLATLTQWKK